MKNLVLSIIVTLIVCACTGEQIPDYQAAIDSCKESAGAVSGLLVVSSRDCLVGYRLPDFEAETSEGKKLSTQSLMGKPTVINFWFVGCKPCEVEVPGFQQLSQQFGDDANFVAIGKNSPAYLRAFLAENPWDFTHINDPEKTLIDGKFQYMWGYPTTLICDQNARIIKTISSGRTDSTAVSRIINEVKPVLDSLLRL